MGGGGNCRELENKLNVISKRKKKNIQKKKLNQTEKDEKLCFLLLYLVMNDRETLKQNEEQDYGRIKQE